MFSVAMVTMMLVDAQPLMRTALIRPQTMPTPPAIAKTLSQSPP